VMAATAPNAANSRPRRPSPRHDMDFIVPSPAPLMVQTAANRSRRLRICPSPS
jgi:hypothetical protein